MDESNYDDDLLDLSLNASVNESFQNNVRNLL